MMIAFRTIPALTGQTPAAPLGLQGPAWSVITAILAGSVAVGLVFAASAGYARKETAVGFVEPGQRVRLMYDAFPFQRFGTYGGVVETVSEIVLSPDEIIGPVRAQEPVYRVSVTLDRASLDAFGREVPLQPDMTVTADIILEERSLLEWLLEPLLSARGEDVRISVSDLKASEFVSSFRPGFRGRNPRRHRAGGVATPSRCCNTG